MSMKKNGMELNEITPIIGKDSEIGNWSLCVGAGISLPVFPSWDELVKDVYEKNTGDSYPKIGEHLKFNNDSVIEAIYLLSKKTNYTEYIQQLSDVLYARLKSNFSEKEWEAFCHFLFYKNPMSVNDEEWNVVVEKMKLLENTNAFKLAEVLSGVICTNKEPMAILSFNGESILQGCLNYFIYKSKERKNGVIGKQYLEYFTSSISEKNKKRLPFYYCHGLMPVFINGKVVNSKICSQEKLVFLESEYMNQMNTTFSWNSASFCNIVRNSRVIFVGVSLTDPNMRRWLSWIHKERVHDIETFNQYARPHTEKCPVSTNHIWINVKPENIQEKELVEALVANLGVRLLWIDNWDQTPIALEKLLGMK